MKKLADLYDMMKNIVLNSNNNNCFTNHTKTKPLVRLSQN